MSEVHLVLSKEPLIIVTMVTMQSHTQGYCHIICLRCIVKQLGSVLKFTNVRFCTKSP